MPAITLNGKCFGKLFLILKENKDEFGPYIQNDIDNLMQKVKNVDVFCSKSGKMTNFLVNKWIACLTNNIEIISEITPLNILLMLDSYSAHWNISFDSLVDKQKFNINRIKYPKRGYINSPTP